jgi:DNA-binding CsgD family transcriptional regulator
MYNNRLDASHHDFLTKLKREHPDLTKSELRFCTYIKIQIPISEIAFFLNITMEGVKKKKYRIRKKINLKRNESLKLYITNL